MSLVAGAYATLGLRRGCSAAALKGSYRGLVKKWHPDRYHGDPTGQAEATAQLRVINRAFQIVAEDIAGARTDTPHQSSTGLRPEAAAREHADMPGRPLSRQELDGIVRSLATEGPVEIVMAWFASVWPFVLAAVLLLTPRSARSPSTFETVVGLLALGYGVARAAWKRLGPLWSRHFTGRPGGDHTGD
jgi:hypothetical protein